MSKTFSLKPLAQASRLVYKTGPSSIFTDVDTHLQKAENVLHPFLTFSQTDLTARCLNKDPFPWAIRSPVKGSGNTPLQIVRASKEIPLRIGNSSWALKVNESSFFPDADQYETVLEAKHERHSPTPEDKRAKQLYMAASSSEDIVQIFFENLNEAKFIAQCQTMLRNCSKDPLRFIKMVEALHTIFVRFHQEQGIPVSRLYVETAMILIHQYVKKIPITKQPDVLSQHVQKICALIPGYSLEENICFSPRVVSTLFLLYLELGDVKAAQTELYRLLHNHYLPSEKAFAKYAKLGRTREDIMNLFGGLRSVLKKMMTKDVYKTLVLSCRSLEELSSLMSFAPQERIQKNARNILRQAISFGSISKNLKVKDIIARLLKKGTVFDDEMIRMVLKFTMTHKSKADWHYFCHIFPFPHRARYKKMAEAVNQSDLKDKAWYLQVLKEANKTSLN